MQNTHTYIKKFLTLYAFIAKIYIYNSRLEYFNKNIDVLFYLHIKN